MLLRLKLVIWTMIVWTTLCGAFAAASKAADDADAEPVQSIEIDSGITAGIPFSPLQLDGYLNVLFAPGGDLDKSGLRLQVGSEGGTFIQGRTEAQANFLLGYSFASGDNSLTLMSGVGSTHFTAHRVRNVILDWASTAELDTKPTQSTMLSAQASYSTALNEYYSQLDVGYAVTKDLYLSPLVAFLGDDRFQRGRIGGEFSGIKFGSADLGLNAGYLEDLGKPSDEAKAIWADLDSDTRHMRDHDGVVNGAFVGADVSVRY
jgi:Cellulose biosynthesis protein BcsS